MNRRTRLQCRLKEKLESGRRPPPEKRLTAQQRRRRSVDVTLVPEFSFGAIEPDITVEDPNVTQTRSRRRSSRVLADATNVENELSPPKKGQPRCSQTLDDIKEHSKSEDPAANQDAQPEIQEESEKENEAEEMEFIAEPEVAEEQEKQTAEVGITEDQEPEEADVSLETRTIREDIERRICINSSDEDEDANDNSERSLPILQKDKDKLFDTLFEASEHSKRRSSLHCTTFDCSGQPPSELLGPGPLVKHQSFDEGHASNLTKRLARLRNPSDVATQRKPLMMASFTSSENHTNHEIAASVCHALTILDNIETTAENDDSDVDLDAVMAERQAAHPNVRDAATSIGIPQDSNESMNLEIDVSSCNQAQQAIVIETTCEQNAESAIEIEDTRNGCIVLDDDLAMRHPRKSKMQSTLLVSSAHGQFEEHIRIVDVDSGKSCLVEEESQEETPEEPQQHAGTQTRAAEMRKSPVEISEEENNLATPDDPEHLSILMDRAQLEIERIDLQGGEGDPEIVISDDEQELPETQGAENAAIAAGQMEEDPEEMEGPSGVLKTPSSEIGKQMDEILDVATRMSERPADSSPPGPSGDCTDQWTRYDSESGDLPDSEDLFELMEESCAFIPFPELLAATSQDLSTPSNRSSRLSTDRAVLMMGTPGRVSNAADSLYKLAKNRLKLSHPVDSPILQEIPERNVGRRNLYQERSETLKDATPADRMKTPKPVRQKPETFSLNSSKLPHIEAVYVQTKCNTADLGSHAKTTLKDAMEMLVAKGQTSSARGALREGLELLMTDFEDQILNLVTLILKKQMFRQRIKADFDQYDHECKQLANYRDLIRDMVQKVLPPNENDVEKVLGFNPFVFEMPPPESVRASVRKSLREAEAKYGASHSNLMP